MMIIKRKRAKNSILKDFSIFCNNNEHINQNIQLMIRKSVVCLKDTGIG